VAGFARSLLKSSPHLGYFVNAKLLDNTKVFGIYEADSEATVRQLVESDPYWQNGIWTEYEIKEWIQAF
jgi:uncharacterized protein YciI